jgi:hypothetical protein
MHECQTIYGRRQELISDGRMRDKLADLRTQPIYDLVCDCRTLAIESLPDAADEIDAAGRPRRNRAELPLASCGHHPR